MKFLTTIVLLGIAAAMTGCGSHDSHEGRDRAVNGRGGNAAPVSQAINQAADKAIGTIDATAAAANQVTADVNHTVVKTQVEAQQVTNDAARATDNVLNTATHDLNSASRDLNKLQNAFR